MILLLTNSFELEDGFLTANNLEQVKDYLASTYPSKYNDLFPQIRNCSLESELNTVRGLGRVGTASLSTQSVKTGNWIVFPATGIRETGLLLSLLLLEIFFIGNSPRV